MLRMIFFGPNGFLHSFDNKEILPLVNTYLSEETLEFFRLIFIRLRTALPYTFH